MSEDIRIDGANLDDYRNYQYIPGRGAYKREAIPLLSGVWDDNGTLKDWAISTTGTVGFALITTEMVGLRWEATADQTDRWRYTWQLPFDYRRDTGSTTPRSGLVFRIKARKVDISSGATDNTDLALVVQAFFHSSTIDPDTGTETAGDTTVDSLGTAVSLTLNALASSGDENANPDIFRWYSADLAAAMTDTQRANLKPGATITLRVAPQEAPGTGIAIDWLAAEMVYTGHDQPDSKYLKAQGLA